MALASAAMPPVYLFRAEAGEVTEILVSGLPLGSLPDLTYRLEVFEPRPGDTLLLISDGLPESVDGAGRALGYEAVERCLAPAVPSRRRTSCGRWSRWGSAGRATAPWSTT